MKIRDILQEQGVAEDPVTEVSRDDSERAKAVRVLDAIIAAATKQGQ